MKVLFIGGSGLISSASSELAVACGMELFVMNRGLSVRYPLPVGAVHWQADVRQAPDAAARLLQGHFFDAVVDWVAYTAADIEQDIGLFRNMTRQFVFISSASAYQKPPGHYLISEDTPLANPFWDYSRNKIACEERLLAAYRQEGFPVTIVRPSLTYGPTQIPLCMGSWQHPWTALDRMRRGQKIIVPGDGTSLWVMTWNGDFAKGFVGLLGREQAIGHAFHITSDEVLTWDQLTVQAGHALGVEPDIIHIPSDLIAAYWPHAHGSLLGDKARSVVFDNSKIKRFVPDFVATVPWQEGVRRALAWFEADAARQTIDEEANQVWDTIIQAYLRAFPSS